MDALFHCYGFCRADIDTGATVYTELGDDLSFLILHRNCFSRALGNAGFAAGTGIFVYYCGHDSLIVIDKRVQKIFDRSDPDPQRPSTSFIP